MLDVRDFAMSCPPPPEPTLIPTPWLQYRHATAQEFKQALHNVFGWEAVKELEIEPNKQFDSTSLDLGWYAKFQSNGINYEIHAQQVNTYCPQLPKLELHRVGDGEPFPFSDRYQLKLAFEFFDLRHP